MKYVFILILLGLIAFRIGDAQSSLSSAQQEVYIALRTDNPANPAGTQADPYDGSTPAKLDALTASLPANTILNFGPGVFQTNTGIVMKDNWTIQGAGMYLTTLQATQALIQQTTGALISARELLTPLVVQDIGIDGNFPDPRAGPWAIHAINLVVAKATVQRCHVQNCSCGLDTEMFIIFLGPDYAPTSPVPGWGIAQDNVVEKSAANIGYVDGIAISGGWDGYEGQITRNTFRASPLSGGNDIAWNLIWCATSSITNNISFGGIFNSDFGGTNSLVLTNNTFLAIKAQKALQVGGAGAVDTTLYPLATNQWKGVVIEDNFFELTAGPFQAGIQVIDGIVDGVVQRNIFRGDASTKYILNSGSGSTFTFAGNLVDPVLAGSGAASGAGVTVVDNTWFDGSPFPTP